MTWLRRWLTFNEQPLWFRATAPPLLLGGVYALALGIWLLRVA